ncbi:MAG: VWA domain-containing protein [Phycisphaeraceae bacterium]|nr:VWA domain-containing protein [Phycisphaeraceae bacterium]
MIDWLPIPEDARFASPERLVWLWAVAPAVLLLVWAVLARTRALARWAVRPRLRESAPRGGTWRRVFKGVLVIAAVASVAVALARPQWNARERTIARSGRDVVFVVDVSRSMLAQDLAPNRLERTKLWIKDVIGTLDGDRVGLVAFAGMAVTKCPLTLDYTFFEMALEELAPDSVSRGGTYIGDAIRRAMSEAFDEFEGRYRDIILITDGEDQGSEPLQAAAAAAQRGIRIIAIGIGDDAQGSRIPGETGGFVRDDGQDVRSRLDRSALEPIARATPGGVYLHVGTQNLDLERMYRDLIASAEGTTLDAERVTEYEEKFQIFLAIALALFAWEGLIRDGR